MAALALYAWLCEFYIFLFSFVRSSLSAEILIRLRANSLPPAHQRPELTQLRLGNLERNGFLQLRPGHLILTAKGRICVSLYRALRAFFRHEA